MVHDGGNDTAFKSEELTLFNFDYFPQDMIGVFHKAVGRGGGGGPLSGYGLCENLVRVLRLSDIMIYLER